MALASSCPRSAARGRLAHGGPAGPRPRRPRTPPLFPHEKALGAVAVFWAEILVCCLCSFPHTPPLFQGGETCRRGAESQLAGKKEIRNLELCRPGAKAAGLLGGAPAPPAVGPGDRRGRLSAPFLKSQGGQREGTRRRVPFPAHGQPCSRPSPPRLH